MVILIKRDFSGGRADAVNSGDLRSRKCCGQRSIEGCREAIDLFHLLPLESKHKEDLQKIKAGSFLPFNG